MQITFLECAKRKDTYATLARESLKFKITQLSMAVIVQTPTLTIALAVQPAGFSLICRAANKPETQDGKSPSPELCRPRFLGKQRREDETRIYFTPPGKQHCE